MNLRLLMYIRLIFKLILRPKNIPALINYIHFKIACIRKSDTVPSSPVSLVIYANKRCNFSCEYCFELDYLNDPSYFEGNDLTLEQLEYILERPLSKKVLRLGILGGEPFINKNIFELIERVNQTSKITTLVTNCSLIKGKVLEKLEKTHPDVLGLSLYSNNYDDVERVHNIMKKKVISWIQYMIGVKEIKEIEGVILFCIKIGCKSLMLINPLPKDYQDTTNVIFDDNIDFLQLKDRLHKKYGKKIEIDWPSVVQRKIKSKSCKIPFYSIHADAQGEFTPCLMMVPGVNKFGHLKDTKSWNSTEIREVRKGLLSGNDKDISDICRYCENLNDDLYKV